MAAISAPGLLRVWEAQQSAHPVVRALHLLAQAWPERGWDAWLHAPVGERDAALLSLHERLFGSALHTATGCPHCGERLESAFTVADIRSDAVAAAPRAARELCLEQHGYAVDYRLPTSDDLLQVTAQRDTAEAAALSLMRRCVSRAQRGALEVDVAALPDAVVTGLGTEMARLDPDAQVQVALVCPACGGASQMDFDVVSYLWSEVDDWAHRILADVHTLARAYGWS